MTIIMFQGQMRRRMSSVKYILLYILQRRYLWEHGQNYTLNLHFSNLLRIQSDQIIINKKKKRMLQERCGLRKMTAASCDSHNIFVTRIFDHPVYVYNIYYIDRYHTYHYTWVCCRYIYFIVFFLCSRVSCIKLLFTFNSEFTVRFCSH